ncbi:MAG: chemotaxis protein CheD [Candidatus Methylomirabilia bacterium]
MLHLLRPGETAPPPAVQLHIGEYRVSRTPEVLYTLLGSCVAVCLFDAAAGIGGMNHILLPGRAEDEGRFEDVARFGLDAVELLVRSLVDTGAARRRLAAKLFGGGHVIRHMDEVTSPGFRNVRFINEVMKKERIPVVGADLGGYEARKVWFRTDTADAILKRVPVKLVATVRREEGRFRRQVLGQVRGEPQSGAPVPHH